MRNHTRIRLIRLHAMLAACFLPVGVMFLVTGGLYTVGIKGSYREEKIAIAVPEPLVPDMAMLTAVAQRELTARQLTLPTGSARIKTSSPYFELEWTGANRDVLVQSTDDPLQARLVLKETTPYRRFVQLHKAKGSWAFKSFAVVWAAGLLALFISGTALAWSRADMRFVTMAAGLLGLLAFVLLALVG
jgi:hypothetical protein